MGLLRLQNYQLSAGNELSWQSSRLAGMKRWHQSLVLNKPGKGTRLSPQH